MPESYPSEVWFKSVAAVARSFVMHAIRNVAVIAEIPSIGFRANKDYVEATL